MKRYPAAEWTEMQPIDILLVEDQQPDEIVIQQAFRDAKLANVVHVAKDGREALAYLRREGDYIAAQTPGLVLVDLDLDVAKMHGFELLNAIKADPSLQSIPVVILTQNRPDAVVLAAYSGGACSFIPKPVTIADLQRICIEFSRYWALVTRIPQTADSHSSDADWSIDAYQLDPSTSRPAEVDPVEPLDILIVDDSESDALLLQISFADSHLVNVLHVAKDGDEALAYLRGEGTHKNIKRPGLVLLDINMPKKDGFEVLAEMKQDPSLRSIPVVMLTMSQQDADVRKAFGNGACSFISKPVNLEKLTAIANQFAIYWALVAKVPRSEP